MSKEPKSDPPGQGRPSLELPLPPGMKPLEEPESDSLRQGRPSFELPLSPGMKPLEEPSRSPQGDPLRQSSAPLPAEPRALCWESLPPVEPHELELGGPFGRDTSDLPPLELADVAVPLAHGASAHGASAHGASAHGASADVRGGVGASTRSSIARTGGSSAARALAFSVAHWRLLLFVVLLIVAVGTTWEWTETWPEGLQLNTEPVQEPIATPQVIAFSEYTLVPQATYRLRARILGRERYRMGRASDLSSYDLALGWGVMSNQRVLDALSVRQGMRRYRYSWDGEEPAHPATMARQSANHHIIAASDEVNDVLEDTPIGGALELEGDLVVVEGPNGWRWRTSLSRLDVGDGACEIFFVRRARRLSLAELRPGR